MNSLWRLRVPWCIRASCRLGGQALEPLLAANGKKLTDAIEAVAAGL